MSTHGELAAYLADFMGGVLRVTATVVKEEANVMRLKDFDQAIVLHPMLANRRELDEVSSVHVFSFNPSPESAAKHQEKSRRVRAAIAASRIVAVTESAIGRYLPVLCFADILHSRTVA